MADPTIKDLAYRGLASVLGGPVDLATMVMRPFGYNVPEQQVVGGSEWIGKRLEDVGLVSSARAPVQEFITSMAIPTPSGLAKGTALGGAALVGALKGGGKTDDALKASEKLIKNNKKMEEVLKTPLTTLNPTGTIFTEYTPEIRALQPLGKNLVSLDKTMGGSPDDLITIYRGTSANQKEIVPGDFVTDSLQLAKDYAGTGKVLKMTVRRGDVLDDITEPSYGGVSEFIYRPNADKYIYSE